MIRKRILASSLAVAAVGIGAAPATSQAAEPNQLCNTNSFGLLYYDANTVTGVPAGSLVRILDYRGPDHYLIRYNGSVGQFERSRINQSTCRY